MKTRFLKVIRDVTSDYSKNFMLVLAIAIGVFGIGAILGAKSVLTREMASNYLGTNPASATLEIKSGISLGLLDSVKSFAGVKEAERHATVMARMKVGERWYPLLLFVIDDFKNKRTNKVYSVTGSAEPSRQSMLVERTALVVMQANEGESITIKIPGGSANSVKIVGTVHDPGLAPAWQEQAGYGYITISTLTWLGGAGQFDQLRIVFENEAPSSESITSKAEELSAWLEKSGHKVHEIQVPPPGKHPHQSQMNAVLSIFTVFSFLILILGSILVATSMATLMVKQVRQIGVMKTIGANSNQIISLYLFMMLIICLAAIIMAIPLSRLAASAFYTQISVLLNLEIADRSIPVWVALLQVASGIVIPFIATSIPVIRGSKVSVRAALDNYGVNVQSQGRELISKWISSISVFNEAFKLSIRNVFRQRSRLVMTLGLLAVAGAMFMTALNVSEAWTNNLSRIYSQRLYDLDVKLYNSILADSLLTKLSSIPGVAAVEGLSYASTSFSQENSREVSHTYPDKGHGSFTLMALPASTKLLNPTVTLGRWLTDEIKDGVVLNQLAKSFAKGMQIGDSIKLTADGKVTRWKVIGFTEDVGSPATAYVSIKDFDDQCGTDGRVNMLRFSYSDRSKENASLKNNEVEALLENENVPVSSTMPVWLLHNAIAAHMKVLVNSLLAMAVLMAIVGTLGLMSTMSMNIMESTREIGVMRAIGGTPSKIRNIVVWEGLAIGGISILIAFLLSLFLSLFVGRFIGNLAFRTPLSLTISVVAVVIWIGIILIGSYTATVYPARRANKISTREALAYE